MDSEYTSKFLTDVLAEQTYNYREPKEIIALFCQSNAEFNSYQKYDELCKLFDLKSKDKLGRHWQSLCGSNYRYFMVFDNVELDGAYTIDKFIEIMKEL